MIKEKDFVELDYTGQLEDGTIFDTTDDKLSHENDLGHVHGPVIICVGEKQLLPGLEKALIGKDKGVFEITLQPEDGFGKKDAKLIQLIPTSKFLKEKIRPGPGLQVNVDGSVGTVKTVSGGRTIVDFNHPLSGRVVKYKVDVKRLVTDVKEQVESLVRMILGDAEVTLAGDKATVRKAGLPDPVKVAIKDKLTSLTAVKEVEFTEG